MVSDRGSQVADVVRCEVRLSNSNRAYSGPISEQNHGLVLLSLEIQSSISWWTQCFMAEIKQQEGLLAGQSKGTGVGGGRPWKEKCDI